MHGKLTQMRRYKTVLGGIALFLAVLPEPARAARLVRCEATLERSVGAVAVPGWGPDEEVARQRARDAAWLLAWADRLPMAMMGTVADPERTWQRDLALRRQLDPKTDWAVPGFAVREGECRTETVPKGEAFVARWEREDREVIRTDPAVAIEGARRRQCFGIWSHRMIKAAGAAHEASDERFAAGWAIGRASTDGLFRCMTRGEPVLEAADGPLAGVDVPGPVECRRPRRVGPRWTASPAWGLDLESAREAALRRDLELSLMRTEAVLAMTANDPDSEARADAVERIAFSQLGGLVVGTDLAEQALTICEVDPPKTARPTWTAPESLACAGWPTGSWQAVGATPAGLGAVLEQKCTAALREGAAGDWSQALLCAASCETDLETTGWDGRILWRPGEPPRATSEDAEKLLAAAIAGKDFHQFGIVTGGLVFEAGFAAAFKANPTAFWASIEQARASGQWGQRAEWVQVGGAWVLSFKDGQ